MQISRILEELGDETINPQTPIKYSNGNLSIESVDIMEMIVIDTLTITTVADILKLILEGTIIGSTEIKMSNGDDDPLDTFEQEWKEEHVLIATEI